MHFLQEINAPLRNTRTPHLSHLSARREADMALQTQAQELERARPQWKPGTLWTPQLNLWITDCFVFFLIYFSVHILYDCGLA